MNEFKNDAPPASSLRLENALKQEIFNHQNPLIRHDTTVRSLETPILFNQEVHGRIRLTVYPVKIEIFKKNLLIMLVTLITAVIIAVFLTARIFVKRVLGESLQHIQKGVRMFSGGNYAFRIEPVRYEDIQPMVSEINLMAQQISDRTAQLEKEVSERCRTETELMENRRQLFTLLQNLPGMAYRCKNDDKFTMEFVSQGVKSLTGYDAWQIEFNREISFVDLILPEDLKTVHEAVNNAMKNDGHFEMEYRIRTATGDIRMVWEQGIGLMHESGEILMLEGFIMDITSRYQAEEQLKKLNEELEMRVDTRTADLEVSNRALKESLKLIKETQLQLVESEKLASLGSMVAGVAHEINNPLGISITAASHLEKKLYDLVEILNQEHVPKGMDILPVLKESLQIVQSNLRRASELVNGFKKVAIDQSLEVKRVFNLADYLKDIMISLQPELKKSVVEVSINCPDNLLIESYPGALSQVFTNLVLNSVRHGFAARGKGTITVRVERAVRHLSILYVDDGIGIPEEMISKIFDPFFTTARGKGGSGLGLHIVFSIISNTFKGTIQCTSRPGKGCTFAIRIPLGELGAIA
jgi:PAS domain S-box-containing protein